MSPDLYGGNKKPADLGQRAIVWSTRGKGA